MRRSSAAPRVVVGVPHPTLEGALARWLEEVPRGQVATIITPHRRLADHLPSRLAELGVEGRGVVARSLAEWTERTGLPVLAARGWRRLEPWQVPLLVGELGLGGTFLPAKGREVRTAQVFAEIAEAEVSPETLLAAAERCRELPHLEELAVSFVGWRRALEERRLADPTSLTRAAVEALGRKSSRRRLALYGFALPSQRERRLLRRLGGFAELLCLPQADGDAGTGLPSGRSLAHLVAPNAHLLAPPPPLSAVDRRARIALHPWQESLEGLRDFVEIWPRGLLVVAGGSSAARRLRLQLELATEAPPPWSERPATRAAAALRRLAAGFSDGTMRRVEVEELLLGGALSGPRDAQGRWPGQLRALGIVEARRGFERLASGHGDPRATSAELRSFVASLLQTLRELSSPASSWRQASGRLAAALRRHLRASDDRRLLLVRVAELASLDGLLEAPPRGVWPAAQQLLAASGEEPERWSAWEENYGVTATRAIWLELDDRQRFRLPWVSPLLSEADRTALNRALSALGSKRRFLRAEQLEEVHRQLAHLAKAAARDELVVSRARTDAAGRPVAASPDWGTGEDVVEGPPVSGSLALLPVERQRLEAAGGQGRWIARIERGRQALQARAANHLTAWDGLVGPVVGEAILALWRRQDGAVRVSPTRLAAFLRCPFQLLLGEILALERSLPPELALGPGARAAGVATHALLAQLWSEIEGRNLDLSSAAGRARSAEIADRLVQSLERQEEEGLGEEPPALRQARYRRLREVATRLLAAEGGGARLVGTEIEVEELAGGAAIEAGGVTVAITGRIDRVDRHPGGLVVVDYKTGALPRERYAPGAASGSSRQLVAYAAALGDDSALIGAVFQGASLRNGLVRWEWGPDALAASRPQLVGELERLVQRTTLGLLPQVEHGEYCDHSCPFGEVCGPARRQLIARKAADPRLGDGPSGGAAGRG